jgi:hypothetical protein
LGKQSLMLRLLTLVLLLTVIARATPLLEVYEIAPRTAHEELRLVLKITNQEEKDLFVFSEGLTDIPFFVRFRQNDEDFDLPSHDCGTGARAHRLRPKTYAFIEVRTMQDIFVSRPVTIRSVLFSDRNCREVVWTNELKFTPDDFKEKPEPNQALQPNAGTAPSADEALPPRG